MSSASQAKLAELHRAHVEARNRARSGDLTVDIQLKQGGLVLQKNTAKLTSDPVIEWTPNMIRFYSFEMTSQVIQGQMRLNNPPQNILFDESPTLDPMKQRKSIDVLFDVGKNVREVMNTLLAEARRRVPNTSWGWKVIVGPLSNAAQIQAAVNGRGPVRINYGDRLLLVPTAMTGSEDATYLNIKYLSGQADDASGRRPKKSTKRKTTGFYGLTTRAVRRKAKGAGVHVKAIHSFKHAAPFRKLPSGVSIGQRGPGVSKRTGKPIFYQGVWAFSISLMRGKHSVNRRG